jgi:hypothetical protein
MGAASPSARTFRKRRDDAATEVLIRLVVSTKQAYRDALLDVLYQYRRREGLFTAAPIRVRRGGRPRKVQQPQPLRNHYSGGSPLLLQQKHALTNGGAGPPQWAVRRPDLANHG